MSFFYVVLNKTYIYHALQTKTLFHLRKKLNPAQRIMAKCRCDKLVCASCKADHIMKCPVVVDMLPTVEAVEATTLKEKI